MKKQMRYTLIIISFFILVSCTNENTSKNSHASVSTDSNSIKQNQSLSFSAHDISFPCAVILSPTKKIIDSLKNFDGEDFDTEFEEIMLFTSDAKKYFESHQIKIINMTSKGNLKFHTTNNKDTIINLAGFYWSILLFNGKDAPIHMGRSDFYIEVDDYMNLKK